MANGDYLSGKPGGDTANPAGGSFIDVPDNYSVPGTMGDVFRPGGMAMSNPGGPGMIAPTPQPHQPLYRDNDEQQIRQLSVENLARLQGQLAQVGLIGPETRFRVGVPDSTTVAAYKRLLGIANNYAISDSEALDFLKSNPSLLGREAQFDDNGNLVSGAAAGGASTSKTISTTEATFTDPVTARETLRSRWQDMFGREPTDAEFKRYQTRLRASEAGNNRTVTTTETDGNGTTRVNTTHQDDTTDPTADVLAQQMGQQGSLGREANTRTAGVDYYGAILNLPGMNPGG